MYQVVYQGHLREGFDQAQVAHGLAARMGLSPEQALEIIKQSRAVLKADLGQAQAFELSRVYWDLGLVVEAQPMPNLGPAAAGPPPQSIAFAFHGKGGEYFRIWIVNLALTIVTLGIYSAWAKVRRKSYFYGNTRLDGVGFEYLADPKKILKGRLIAVGILLAHQMVAALAPVLGLATGLGLVLFFPWALVKSLAFNARNSAYRNIRLRFDGRYGEAFLVFIIWPLLGMVSLGLAWPVVYRRQKKFIVDHHHYGDQDFDLGASSKDYYKLFGLALLLGLGGWLALFCLGLLLNVLTPSMPGAGLSFLTVFTPLAGIVVYISIYAFFSAKASNLLFNTSRSQVLGFHSTLPALGFAWVVISNTLATALTLGLFHPWASVRAWRYRLAHLSLTTSQGLEGFVAGQEEQVGALGSEASDLMGFDFGL